MNQEYTGNKISEIRKQKGWTQKELAEMMHVSIAAVSKWERGLNYPDLSLMEPLANHLDISVAELLGLEAETPEKVIQSIAEISKNEKEDRRHKNARRSILLICDLAIFIVMMPFFLQVTGKSDVPWFMRIFTSMLSALALGTASWGLGIKAMFFYKNNAKHYWSWYSLWSFCVCSIALYIPSCYTGYAVRKEDISTVLDTAGALNYASLMLLAGTILLNLSAWILNRKEKK